MKLPVVQKTFSKTSTVSQLNQQTNHPSLFSLISLVAQITRSQQLQLQLTQMACVDLRLRNQANPLLQSYLNH